MTIRLLGETVRRLRRAKFGQQKELAQKAGVQPETIRKAENGLGIGIPTAAAIADALDVQLQSLIHADDLLKLPEIYREHKPGMAVEDRAAADRHELAVVRAEQQFHNIRFAGRKETIDTVSNVGGGEYLLVTGAAGVGKSALLSEIATRESARTIFHLSKSANSADISMRSLLAQVSRLRMAHGLAPIASSRYAAHGSDLSDYLWQEIWILTHHLSRKPILLILDSVDLLPLEAFRDTVGLLPPSLPPTIAVILSSQPNSPFISHARSQLRSMREVHLKGRLTKEEIKVSIERTLIAQEMTPSIIDSTSLDSIDRGTQGHPLFVFLAASQFISNTRSRIAHISSQNFVPQSDGSQSEEQWLANLYSRAVEGRNHSLRAHILRVLAITNQPALLSASNIHKITLSRLPKTSKEKFKQTLFELGPAIITDSTGSIAIFHDRFISHILDRQTTEEETTSTHADILRWLIESEGDTPGSHWSDYGLAFRPKHALRAGNELEAARILTDPSFYVRRLSILDGFKIDEPLKLLIELSKMALPTLHDDVRLWLQFWRNFLGMTTKGIRWRDFAEMFIQRFWDYDICRRYSRSATQLSPSLYSKHPLEETGIGCLASAFGLHVAPTVAATPSSGIAVALEGRHLYVFDLLNHTFEAHDWNEGAIDCIAIRPDGKQIATTDPEEGKLTLWAIAPLTLERVLGYNMIFPRFIDNTKLLAVDSSGELAIFDLSEANHRSCPMQSMTPGYHLHKSSQRLVLPDGESVHVCDLNTGEIISTFHNHQSPVVASIFDQSGTRVISSSMDSIYVWDVETGAILHSLELAYNKYADAAIAQSSTAEDVLRTFLNRFAIVPVALMERSVVFVNGSIKGVVIAPLSDMFDGGYIVEGLPILDPGRPRMLLKTKNDIALWDLAEEREIGVLSGIGPSLFPKDARGGAWFDGDRCVVYGPDGYFRLWDLKQLPSRRNGSLSKHEGTEGRTPSPWFAITAIETAKDGSTVVTRNAEGHLRVWLAQEGGYTSKPIEGVENAYSIFLHPDEQHLLIATASSLRVWMPQSEEFARTTGPACGKVCTSKAGLFICEEKEEIAAYSHDLKQKIWAIATDEMAHCLLGQQIVCVVSDHAMSIYDTHRGSIVREINITSTPSRLFSADATGLRVAAIGSGNTRETSECEIRRHLQALHVWNTITGNLNTVSIELVNGEPLSSIAFHPYSDRVIVGLGLTALFLWDLTTGEEIGKWYCQNRIRAFNALEDGTILVGDGADLRILSRSAALIAKMNPEGSH